MRTRHSAGVPPPGGATLVSGTEVVESGEHLVVVTATDGSGNIATAQARFRILRAPRDVPFSVCSLGNASIRNAAALGGRNRITGETGNFGHLFAGGDLSMSGTASLGGDALVGGNLIMTNASLVDGDVLLGGSSSLSGTAHVTGRITQDFSTEDLCTCGFDLAAVMAQARSTNDNASLESHPEIAPHFAGGVLSLRGNTQVTLPSGEYFLTGLTIRNSARLSVAPGAQVTIF